MEGVREIIRINWRPSELSGGEKLRLAAFRQEQEHFAAPTAAAEAVHSRDHPRRRPPNDTLATKLGRSPQFWSRQGIRDHGWFRKNSLVPTAAADPKLAVAMTCGMEQARKQAFSSNKRGTARR